MNWTVAVVALFGAGIAGSISPCVLPLLPGVVLVLADGRTGVGRVMRMVVFALAAATTFAVLGGLAGSVHGAVTGSVAARIAGGWLMVLALATVAVDRGLWTPPQWSPPASTRGWGTPLALGVGCGAAWSPCVGPLLGVAATAAASAGSAWRGATLLFAFGIGVATPAVVLAVAPFRVPTWAKRAGVLARRLTPIAMVSTGLLLVTGWYVPFVQRLGSGT